MIILDTHIWIWWVDNNERLNQKYRDCIEEYQSQGLGVSIILVGKSPNWLRIANLLFQFQLTSG